jgi:hypothetical protein
LLAGASYWTVVNNNTHLGSVHAMKRIVVTGILASLIVVFTSASQGDTNSDPESPSASAAPPEPTTESPVSPAPGDETVVKDPFALYSTGGVENEVPYSVLTPAEQAVVDHGRDVTGWSSTHDAFRRATIERAQAAAAASAAAQLGVENVNSTGVVP